MPFVRNKGTGIYMPKSEKFLDKVKEVLRYHHYSIRTEHTYVNWITKYIKYNNKKHSQDMGKYEFEKYLSHLAIDLNIAKSTQDLAFNVLLFLYEKVLLTPIKDKIQATRSKKTTKLPVV